MPDIDFKSTAWTCYRIGITVYSNKALALNTPQVGNENFIKHDVYHAAMAFFTAKVYEVRGK